MLEDATTGVEIFKAMRWVKPKLCQGPPPLMVGEDRRVSDPLERTENLRDILMASFNAAHDLSSWEDELPESILWDRILSLDDVSACTILTGDKAPGSDKMTFCYSRHTGLRSANM